MYIISSVLIFPNNSVSSNHKESLKTYNGISLQESLYRLYREELEVSRGSFFTILWPLKTARLVRQQTKTAVSRCLHFPLKGRLECYVGQDYCSVYFAARRSCMLVLYTDK